MTLNINEYKNQNFYSVQADSSTKHTARVKPSQYIAQHLYKQTSKSNCSSCSSQTSYLAHPRSSKVFSLKVILWVDPSLNDASKFMYKSRVNNGFSTVLQPANDVDLCKSLPIYYVRKHIFLIQHTTAIIPR